MGWIKKVIVAILLSYLARSLYIFLVSLGVGVHHNNVHPGKCRIVPGISCGSEQISVTVDGLAFITSGYKDLTNCNPSYLKGHLYTFDFNNPDNNVTRLKISGSGTFDAESFIPHGMDIFEEGDVVHVYVVNHANDVESIEAFVYHRNNPEDITHVKTFTDDKFICLNDITVVDRESFYVTNLQKYCKLSKHMMLVEYFILRSMKTSSVVYYNQGRTEFVVNGIFMNGLTLSKDKKHVLVVHGEKDVHVYARQPNGHLTYKRNVPVGYGMDNIFLDKQTGNFFVAYFKNFGFLQAAENKTEHCSSSGGMLTVGSETMERFSVTEVFHDDGKDFVCGASSFVHHKGQYLLGTVFHKLGYCERE